MSPSVYYACVRVKVTAVNITTVSSCVLSMITNNQKYNVMHFSLNMQLRQIVKLCHKNDEFNTTFTQEISAI